MKPTMYLIWSEEHGAWWRTGHHGQTWGYTHSITEAGRYTEVEANQIVDESNKVIHPESGLPDRKFNEIAIKDPMQ